MEVGPRVYDLFYRTWAPWDRVGARRQLRELLERGEVAPATHPSALDVGCGTGATVVHLAERGFQVTGVDFSPVALERARARARQAGVEGSCRFLEADLTAVQLLAAEDGTYDLLVDGGTLDDLEDAGRATLAGHLARLARPGATLLMWCFYASRRDLPLISLSGPSRMMATIEPGEEERLFGTAFEVVRFEREYRHQAFLELRRRS